MTFLFIQVANLMERQPLKRLTWSSLPGRVKLEGLQIYSFLLGAYYE